MAKGAYLGVANKARKIKGGYIGVNGVARKIKKAYIGVNGVARLCWAGALLSYGGSVGITSANYKRPSTIVTAGGLFILSSLFDTSNSYAATRVTNQFTVETLSSLASGSGCTDSGVAFNDKAVVIGGHRGLNQSPVTGGSHYSTNGTVGSTGNILTKARGLVSACCNTSNIVIAGGYTGYDTYWESATTPSYTLADVDASSSYFTRVAVPAALSEARHSIASEMLNNNFIFAGGVKPNSTKSTAVDVYNSSLTKLTNLTLQTSEGGNSASAIFNGKMVLVGSATYFIDSSLSIAVAPNNPFVNLAYNNVASTSSHMFFTYRRSNQSLVDMTWSLLKAVDTSFSYVDVPNDNDSPELKNMYVGNEVFAVFKNKLIVGSGNSNATSGSTRRLVSINIE